MTSLADAIGLARSVAIYHGQPWRTAALRRLYRELIRPGDLVFDIGAHVGSRTRIMTELGARVVAVEPQPLFADFIARFIANEKVVLRREAVGSNPGERVLNISSRHPTVSSLSGSWIDTVADKPGFEKVQWDRSLSVPVTTLDRLVDDYGMPRFCKIDVEGMEGEILAGLSRPIPMVAFEYLPASMDIAEDCIDRLGALGAYRFNRTEGESHRFVHASWLAIDDMRAGLARLSPEAGFGDIYARREDAS